MNTKLLFALLTSALFPLAAFSAEVRHEHHHAHHAKSAKGQGAAPTEVPALRILMPTEGAKVGTQLALVFETPGDLRRLTMSAPTVGTHLHIEAEGISLMPVNDQLIRLGGDRYLFVFDLPAKPGPNTLKVFWADGDHQTIESTIKSVNVIVEAVAQP